MDDRRRVQRALSGGATVAAIGLPQVIALGALAATPLGPIGELVLRGLHRPVPTFNIVGLVAP